MATCVQCGSTDIRKGLCAVCGAPQAVVMGSPQVVMGTRADPPPVHYKQAGLVLKEIVEEGAPAPPPLAVGFLQEIVEEEAPQALPEFVESTSLDVSRPAKARPAPPVAAKPTAQVIVSGTICPACGTDLPDPLPTFCDACGNRLPRTKKTEASAPGASSAAGEKKCRQCGFRNSATRFSCTNCGERLPGD
ncbi:MAG: hypothetical protein U1E65_12395 [Myxococcota bacterium]